jgi:SecD/SecF fusion protein
MQNKGVIRFFAILMAIVCAFQLSFTYVTYKIRKQAEQYANGDPKKEFQYLDSISSEVVYDIGLAEYTFRQCQEREINLGLDLQGGMNVILEIAVDDIIRALSNNSNDTTFNNALRLAKEKQRNSTEDFVVLFGESFEELDPNAKLSVIFSTMELKDRISYNSTNAEVISVIREETRSAIDNAFEILSTRIDKFGVAQPKIQRLETAGRILVELPGVKDQSRVRKILQSTASLEFWETYNIGEIYQGLLEANNVIKNRLESEKSISTLQDEKNTEAATGSLSELEKGAPGEAEEGEGLALLDRLKSDTGSSDSVPSELQQMQDDYPLFAVLTPNVYEDYVPKGSVIGRSLSRDTAKVNDYLGIQQVRQLFPRDIRFMWSAYPTENPETGKMTDIFELHAIKVSGRDGQAALTGDVVTSSSADFDQNTGETEVMMNMNAEGTRAWARLTKENIDKSIAVVLDNYVYSAPVVQVEINNGRSRITGNFDINEATDLANMLKSGKLPAPARIISDTVVGPTLGHESIRSGMSSFMIAFFVVLFYMVFYYSRKAGLVADVALFVNLFFIIGVLASLGAALTLPGIAGIVLTIGMSVDANVLIFERIREELAAGKGMKLAVTDGYKNAYSAIIDANVTTLLTGVILYFFGTGPIKGFATTLVIGILTSLFCAIFITRLIFIRMMERNKTLTFATKMTEGAFKNTNINFIGKRKIFYILSSVIILIGVGSLFTKGLSLGVDFRGGRAYIINFEDKESVSTTEIAQHLEGVFGTPPEVVTFGGANQVRVVTTYKIEETATTIDDEVEGLLYQGLQPMIGDTDKETFIENYIQSSLNVGPTIAHDIKIDAMKSIFFALLFMFVYIFVRFRNWQFGLGAVAALIHDSLIVLSLFSIFYGILPFSLEIDQAFIAAILTVVGYSINDTVVVFDRIRENIGLHRKRDDDEIINMSLNSTLSRTFSTSLSTFFVLLAIFIFGGEVIRGFTFALLVGIVVGTYSSLFVASPIVYDTIKKVSKSGQHTLSGKQRS